MVGGGECDEGEGEVAFEGCVEGGGRLVIGLVKAGDGGLGVETLRRGSLPSGMPTTQHSAICGWEEMACSIAPA